MAFQSFTGYRSRDKLILVKCKDLLQISSDFEFASKVVGNLHGLQVSVRNIELQASLAAHNEVLILTLIYGGEAWNRQKKGESQLNSEE